MLFLGIDAGTQGVRAIVVDLSGLVLAESAASYPSLNKTAESGRYEQNPEDWWSTCAQVVSECVSRLRKIGRDAVNIAAIAVDGTSGTLVPLDRENRPLTNGMMYNDLRGAVQAEAVGRRSPGLEEKLGYHIGSSFSLARMLWMKEEAPRLYERCHTFASHTDYLVGKLCGDYRTTDYVNAQKLGYDARNGCWPEELERDLGLDMEKLSQVIPPGQIIAPILPRMVAELGLPVSAVVVAGATDAYAAALATGAVRLGDCVSVIGTTFVCKTIAAHQVVDPAGVAYSYRMPEGRWMFGGASNLGGRCLNEFARDKNFAQLDREAEALLPTGVLSYPLYGRGERFPFTDTEAEAFFIGNIWDGRLYPALMEGVGYGERLAYERLEAMGCAVGPVIRATGGGSKSRVWLKIRASILNRTLCTSRVTTAGMGAAMLAAMEPAGGLLQAVDAMAQEGEKIEPEPGLTERYNELYMGFREECRYRYGI